MLRSMGCECFSETGTGQRTGREKGSRRKGSPAMAFRSDDGFLYNSYDYSPPALKKTLQSVTVGPAFCHKTTQKCLFWFDEAACVPALQADPLRVELLATELFLCGLTHGSLVQ